MDMAEIVILGGLVLWIAVALALTMLLTRYVSRNWLRVLLRICIFILLLIAPLADELIARHQFRELCSTPISVDREKALGRTVSSAPSKPTPVSGAAVPMSTLTWRYVDATTKEVVLEFVTVHAKGGWLVHAFSLSERDHPLVFPSYCEPEERRTIFAELHIQKLR
jgi:hypothetical protein